MTTPDPKPQKRIYAKEITSASDARGMSEAVAALMMAGRMKEAALLHVYQTDMKNEEWEELICFISHRISHRRASAAQRPSKTAHKPQAR